MTHLHPCLECYQDVPCEDDCTEEPGGSPPYAHVVCDSCLMRQAHAHARADACGRVRAARAAARAWVHNAAAVRGRRAEFLAISAHQRRAARAPERIVACGCCEDPFPIYALYRCYQCDLWLCAMCARVHFPEAAAAREEQAALDLEARP